MRVELPIKEAIDAIWIMTGTYEASPKLVSIGVVLDKTKREYISLYSKIPLPKRRGLRWMKFPFKSKISKYFKIVFEDNYGDKSSISIRQIRFVRAKERKSLPSSSSSPASSSYCPQNRRRSWSSQSTSSSRPVLELETFAEWS
jgi:hypothetical protein